LVLVSIYCVYTAIQNRNVVGPGQGSRYFQRMTKGTPGDEVDFSCKSCTLCMCALPPKQEPMAKAQTRGGRHIPFFLWRSSTTGICKEESEGLRTLPNPTSLTSYFRWQTIARPRDPCQLERNLARGALDKCEQSRSLGHRPYGEQCKSEPKNKIKN